MQLEAVGVTQPQKHGPFQIRLKFGKHAYCVMEVRIGEDAAEIAKKLRELAAQSRREASSDVAVTGGGAGDTSRPYLSFLSSSRCVCLPELDRRRGQASDHDCPEALDSNRPVSRSCRRCCARRHLPLFACTPRRPGTSAESALRRNEVTSVTLDLMERDSLPPHARSLLAFREIHRSTTIQHSIVERARGKQHGYAGAPRDVFRRRRTCPAVV
jgi:hypothetical protein